MINFEKYGIDTPQSLMRFCNVCETFYNRQSDEVRAYEMPKFKKRKNTFEFVEECLKNKQIK